MKLTKRVLLKKAKPADFRYPEQNFLLVQRMRDCMTQANGIGLAAPQIGISRRVFVMRIQDRNVDCFNPEITGISENMADLNEGCLSFPGEQCIIRRPDWIDVVYQDFKGRWQSERFADLWARCFQHELDHLDGITMWHRQKEQYAEQS